jgi:putative SOS response-associated peptidase YedK
MINARSETVGEKPAFRDALAKRRCLVLADGFYEWRKNADGAKTPMWIHLPGKEPFAFAGLYAFWKQPDGEWQHSCTILTTVPNELMAPIHDRMPVILPREAEELWLGGEDIGALRSLLAPYPAEAMAAPPVSPRVNNVRNDSPECIEPAA